MIRSVAPPGSRPWPRVKKGTHGAKCKEAHTVSFMQVPDLYLRKTILVNTSPKTTDRLALVLALATTTITVK